MEEQWVTLGEAARLLGVHPSTVRTWSDQGKLPVKRTQGGHRRFPRHAIELWDQSQTLPEPEDVDQMVANTIHQVQLEMKGNSLESEPWYLRLDEETRNQFSQYGRRLSHAILHYLTTSGEDVPSESRLIGSEYASKCCLLGLGRIEATRAFLFFHNALLDAVIKSFEVIKIASPAAWSETLRKFNRITDEVLIALLERYDTYVECKS